MKKTNVLKIIGTGLFYLIIIICLFLTGIMIKAKIYNEQAEIFGYKLFVVLTGSMEPNLGVGDLIVVKNIDPKDIQIDDVITFKSISSENIITHRIKGISTEDGLKFITKGDANNIEDPNMVSSEKIIGKVKFDVPIIGNILKTIQANGKAVLIILSAIIFFAILIKNIKRIKALGHKVHNN